MAPNSSPSPTYSSICCCSKYFRKPVEQPQTTRSNKSTKSNRSSRSVVVDEREPIEIKVNGTTHLTIPHVAIKKPTTINSISERVDDVTIQIEGEDMHGDVYQTARTSRHTDGEQMIPMNELMRMVRMEEGLDVTPRPVVTRQPIMQLTLSDLPSTSSSSNIPPILPNIIKRNYPRKAEFDEDGDITSRTINSHKIYYKFEGPEQQSRKISIGSIGVPVLQINQSSQTPPSTSMITRRISSTPQMIATVFAFAYACLTTIFTTFANLFIRT